MCFAFVCLVCCPEGLVQQHIRHFAALQFHSGLSTHQKTSFRYNHLLLMLTLYQLPAELKRSMRRLHQMLPTGPLLAAVPRLHQNIEALETIFFGSDQRLSRFCWSSHLLGVIKAHLCPPDT
ncbi:unnamed protein product [Protopolystoma xenopodis]|uniref:Uncharacterized protein n=1 Tax=Protopolystoma xenopodis TaxID=117903 RepID=A0A448WQT5_9PLAT|nr:unnamed protein product [Protopolystoma xenopodis]